jgi:TatD DNase family protein
MAARQGAGPLAAAGAMGWVDAHLHPQDYPPGTDVGQVLRQARAAGVEGFVCNGTEEADWADIERLAQADPSVVPFFGVHPWFVAHASDQALTQLETQLQRVPAGVGEIGLDAHAEPLDRPRQEALFSAQLALAERLGRPATVHCVRAWGWLLQVLQRRPAGRGVFLLHAYGGAPELIPQLVRLGAYFSFSGTVLNPAYGRARRALPQVPAERLLLETDAPNMLPAAAYHHSDAAAVAAAGHNHPANLPAIAAGIAALRQCSPADLRDQVAANIRAFLGPLCPPAWSLS